MHVTRVCVLWTHFLLHKNMVITRSDFADNTIFSIQMLMDHKYKNDPDQLCQLPWISKENNNCCTELSCFPQAYTGRNGGKGHSTLLKMSFGALRF